MRTWRKNYQPPSRRFQDAYLAQKLSTTKPPVPGCVPGAKTINHQATGSRMRTWRKNYQPPSRRFQDAYLAQKLSTTKPPVPGCVLGVTLATSVSLRVMLQDDVICHLGF